ncbi:MAG: GNAT family N-acetyltransferase [Pseudomonadota bacterium]
MTRFTAHIPQIETDRLILRAPALSDLDHLEAFYQTERSHWVGGPLTRNQCWRVIAGTLGHWLLNGFGMWALHHKGDDRIIGMLGFLNMDGWHEPEMAWNLHEGFEGKGLALEAALAARAHAAAHLGLDRMISYADPANTRSIALMHRLGARFEREDALLGKPVHIYRHPKSAEVR